MFEDYPLVVGVVFGFGFNWSACMREGLRKVRTGERHWMAWDDLNPPYYFLAGVFPLVGSKFRE